MTIPPKKIQEGTPSNLEMALPLQRAEDGNKPEPDAQTDQKLKEESGAIAIKVQNALGENSSISQEAAETIEKLSLRKAIFSKWTGIDESVYEQLDNIEDLWNTLIKELGIIAELAAHGASQKLPKLIHESERENRPYEEIDDDFNALVEYGCLFDELDDMQREVVGRKEIQEEFGHFWRIMGIESMRPQRIKRIVGELGEVMETAGNLERELGVIIERRISRNYTEPYIPVKKESQPEGNIHTLSSKTVSTNRRNFPYVSAAMSLPEKSEQDLSEFGRNALILFNKLLTKYPIEKAVALLDFLLSKNDIPSDLSLSAVQQYAHEGKQFVKVITIGSQAILHTKRNADFSHSITHVISGEAEGFALGAEQPIPYMIQVWEVTQSDQIYILSQDYAAAIRDLRPDELSEILNRKGATGKILPTNNLQKHLHQTASGIVSVKCQQREEVPVPEFTPAGILDQLSPLFETIEAADKPLQIHLEAAHIHADRPISKAIEDGAKVGGVVARALSSIGHVELASAPMIDDDHVVNSLDYEGFEEMLKREGFNAREIIFESSPLIYEISLDILKLVLAKYPEKLKMIGNNLYLEPEENMRIELVQDTEKEFISGCVLFDAALCLYKLYPEICTRIYQQKMLQSNPASPLGYTCVHQLMLQIYKNSSTPEIRTAEIKRLLPKDRPTIEDLETKKEERPYLDALETQFDEAHETRDHMIINVMEETYSSQQKKLAALTDMVGLLKSRDIVTVMFNQESGAITFER